MKLDGVSYNYELENNKLILYLIENDALEALKSMICFDDK